MFLEKKDHEKESMPYSWWKHLTRYIGIREPRGSYFIRQFVEGLSTGLIPAFFVGEQVLERDPAMGADLMVRNFVPFQEPYEVLPRHAQIVGRRLGGERFVLGHEDDCFALRHEPHQPGEVNKERVRNVRSIAMLVDQRDVVRAGEYLGQGRELLFRDQ